MMAFIRSRLDSRRDAGFTLIELLVSMVVLAALGSAIVATVIGANTSATATKSEHDLNEEARLALNRMARELRQATAITNVINPDGPAYSSSAITAVTFSADFDGDGCINGVAPTPAPTPAPTCNSASSANPEILTYCWDPSASVRQLYLIVGAIVGNSCQSGLPILAGQVTAFKLSYRSNQYLYDANGDGTTTWMELDQAGPPVGNKDNVLDQPELSNIDSVVIDLSVSAKGTHQQSYTTQVDLRNLS